MVAAITILHSLTMTTPDDPAYENKPSDWNQSHLATISINAGDVSAVGLNTAKTNVTWTVNSSGISLNAGGYAGTGLTTATTVGTALVGTVNTSGVSLGVPAWLTTARASNDAVGLNTAGTQVTWTVNSSGISLNAGAYLTTARASNDAVGLNTAGTNVTWTVNSSGISLNAGGYLTTARASTDAIGLNTAQSNVTWTVNSSGLSLDARGYAGTGTSATNASVTLNSNGIAVSVAAPTAAGVGLNTAQTNVTWTVNTSGISLNAAGYAGTVTGATGGSLTVNSSGVSMNLPAYLTTADLSQNSSKYVQNWKLTGNTAGTTSSAQGTDLWFSGGNNISVSGNSNTIVLSVGNYLTTARASTDAVGLNTAATNVTWTVNSSGLSLNAAGYAGTGTSITGNASITLDSGGLKFNGSGLAGTSTGATNATVTLNSSGIAVSVGNYITTARASNDAVGLNTAATSVTWTVNSSGISLDAGAYLTTARRSTDAIGLNTAGTNITWTANSSGLSIDAGGYAGTGTSTGTTVGTNIKVTLNTNGISILNPEPYISIFELEPYANSSTMNIANGVSVSHAQFFQLPQNGSFSFIRIPASFTTNTTTLSTAAASLSASAQVASTWNAVVYQMDTGANSRSLTWVASGSAGFTFLNSISMAADGTSGSYTNIFSYPVEGAQTSTSNQWTSGNTNMGLSSTVFHSLYSGHRFIDIPFANSLSAGPYWIIMGWSSSSASNSARFSAATNNIISASYYMGMSRGSNAATGIMGSTNRTSAYHMVGSFSTAGGGTTAALPISAISTVASNARFYCMFIRSA